MATAFETCRTGDRLPPIALPDPTGATIDLSDQARAGHTILFWIAGPAPDPARAAAFAAVRDRLAAVDAMGFAVTPGYPLDGVEVLCDPEARLARTVGLTGPGWVVLDPERRLTGVFPEPEGLEPALAACARIFGRTAEAVVRAQAPVLVLPGALDADQCRRLIAFWEASEKLVDGVATGQAGSSRGDRSIKRRSDVPVVDNALLGDFSASLSRRIAPAIRKSFQRVITRCETPRIGCYDSQERGEFGPHRDNTTPFTAHRLFAVSLNLNDDYTGGEVRFPEYGRALYRPDAGDAVIFSCSLLHQALPTRTGRRFGLFTFLFDEEGAASAQRVLEREVAQGRDPYLDYPLPTGQ